MENNLTSWLIVLENKHRNTLGAVRCLPGLEAAAANDFIWLKISDPALLSHPALCSLPAQHTYAADSQGLLFHPGTITPVDTLQINNWQPLKLFLPVEPPVSALPGKTGNRVKMKLLVSHKNLEGNALLTSLALWKAYAEKAPASRLEAVEFAVSENNEVLIVGKPLPPVPGKEYWKHEQLLFPCGFEPETTISCRLMINKLDAANESWILLDDNGHYQVIPKMYFVRGSRSAIRLTNTNTNPVING